MNHSHKEMNLCFFSIEFARQFGGVGRFPLQLLEKDHRFATSFGIREFCAGQKEKQLQLLCVSSARHGLASFWGLPEIRSQNLIHDHQVFFGGSSLKRMRREANPCWHSAVLQTDVRWQQCYWFPRGFEPSHQSTTGSQNNRWLNSHWRDGDSPSAEATWSDK